MLSENEIKAKALIIGMELSRQAWYTMTATQADEYCQQKARTIGADDREAGIISYLAMNYVIKSEG